MKKYITNFNTVAEYNTFKNSSECPYVNVSYIQATDEVRYTKDTVDNTPFTVKLLSYDTEAYPDGATLTLTRSATRFGESPNVYGWLKYSLDGGTTWTYQQDQDVYEITGLHANDEVQLIGSFLAIRDLGFYYQTSFEVSGNLMSLIGGDNFAYATYDTLHGGIYKNYGANIPEDGLISFYMHEGGYKGLTDASDLWLPTKGLTTKCFYRLFYECDHLVSGPTCGLNTLELPEAAAKEMFKNCTSLTSFGDINIGTAYNSSMESMFEGCTSLVNMPDITVDTTYDFAVFQYAFKNCKLLEPAEGQLVVNHTTHSPWSVFRQMFQVDGDEGSMVHAPIRRVNIDTNDNIDYMLNDMFSGQTNLTGSFTIDFTGRTENAGYLFSSNAFYNTGITDIQIYGTCYPFSGGLGLPSESTGTITIPAQVDYNTNDLYNDIPSGWTITQRQ